jgi:hypothetical protein
MLDVLKRAKGNHKYRAPAPRVSKETHIVLIQKWIRRAKKGLSEKERAQGNAAHNCHYAYKTKTAFYLYCTVNFCYDLGDNKAPRFLFCVSLLVCVCLKAVTQIITRTVFTLAKIVTMTCAIFQTGSHITVFCWNQNSVSIRLLTSQ